MIQKCIDLRVSFVVVLLLTALVVLPQSALAQRERGASRFVPDSQVRAAFEPVVRDVRASVVELIHDEKRVALGTIVDEAGYLLTKASEVMERGSVRARLGNGQEVETQIVGIDRFNDLAMLKIEAEVLTAVELVDDEPAMGRWVASVGQSKTPHAVGIVSSKVREVKPPQLVMGVMLSNQPAGPPRVVAVSRGFGAAEAGMKVGDIVAKIEGKRVIAMEQVISRLQGRSVGDKVAVTVQRGDVDDPEDVELAVRLSELLPDPQSRSERMNRMGGEISERRRGFERVIQHDAEIRPEFCGGPIVNLKGQVIGLNIARAGRIETYALPSSLIKEKLALLKAGEGAPAAERRDAEPVNGDMPEREPANAG